MHLFWLKIFFENKSRAEDNLAFKSSKKIIEHTLLSRFLHDKDINDRESKIICLLKSGLLIQTKISQLYLDNLSVLAYDLFIDHVLKKSQSYRNDGVRILCDLHSTPLYRYKKEQLTKYKTKQFLKCQFERRYRSIIRSSVKRHSLVCLLWVVKQVEMFSDDFFIVFVEDPYSPLNISVPLLEFVLQSMAREKEHLLRSIAEVSGSKFIRSKNNFRKYTKKIFKTYLFSNASLQRLKHKSISSGMKASYSRYIMLGIARNLILSCFGNKIKDLLQGKKISEVLVRNYFYYLNRIDSYFSELKPYSAYEYLLLGEEDENLLELAIKNQNLYLIKYLVFWSGYKALKRDKFNLSIFHYLIIYCDDMNFVKKVLCYLLSLKKKKIYIQRLLTRRGQLDKFVLSFFQKKENYDLYLCLVEFCTEYDLRL